MRSCQRRRLSLITFLLLFSCLFSLWKLFTGSRVADQLKLQQVRNKPRQSQVYTLQLQSDHLVKRPAADVVNSQPITVNHDDITPLLHRCEVVHIAIVAAGYNTSRDVVTLIKSILYYRQSSLHFHFISDSVAHHILSTLFSSWLLPSVNISFYPVEDYRDKVDIIQNVHYSGVYGLMKLILTEALPGWLSQVIVLDTDMIFTTDITQLWKIMSEMKEKHKLLGLVENQSDWYLGTLWKNYKIWPAIGRGFNTGVMLMDLDQLRVAKWYQIWRSAALKEKQPTSLADQDIINAVIKYNPSLHYTIPCYWNVQLSEHTLSESCYQHTGQVKVIHWNSPLKTNIDLKHVQCFRNFYNIFTEMDGSHLRAELLYCSQDEQPLPISNTLEPPVAVGGDDQCWEFKQHHVYRTHPYFIDYHYQQSAGQPDVTLVAQLSYDRLQMLEALAEHWEGPMSLALFLTDSEAQLFIHFALHSPVISRRKNIGFHIVYKLQYNTGLYPVNYLRNVALKNVNTAYVFLSDIDFLPSYGINEYLQSLLANDQASQKNAFVVPAFETLRYRLDFPADRANLLDMLDNGLLYTFRYHVWRKGHAATDYHRWRTATEPYKVEWAADYEPYIVVRRDVPQYDTRFVGFGWNKVSHIMRLDATGYQFKVLPDHFIIHMPHSPSLDIIKFRSSPNYRNCLQQIKEEYQRSLVKEFGTDAFKYLIT